MRRFFTLRGAVAVALILSVLICIIAGVITRNSYTNEISKLPFNPDTSLTFTANCDVPDTTMQVLLDSQIIVKAVALDDIDVEYEDIKTTLKIVKVYKGDINVGDIIDFWQDIGFGYNIDNNRPSIFNRSFMNPMQKGKEYFVFGNQKTSHPAYEKENPRKVYVCADFYISYFLTEITYPDILSEEMCANGEIKYIQIQENEFNCFSEGQRDNINQFKKRMISALSIR